jgi:transposase
MVRAVEAGASRQASAAKFEVSPGCVVKLVQRWRQKGTLEPDPVGGGRPPKRADHAERVHALLAARTPPSRSAPTSPPPGAPGASSSRP